VQLEPLRLDLPLELVDVLIRLMHELLELLEALGVRTDLLADLLDDLLPQRTLVEVVAMVDLPDLLSELVEAAPCVLEVVYCWRRQVGAGVLPVPIEGLRVLGG
jgi:hypothetical protein